MRADVNMEQAHVLRDPGRLRCYCFGFFASHSHSALGLRAMDDPTQEYHSIQYKQHTIHEFI